MPLLPPSKAHNATFHHGANFAITGATALDTSYFVAKGLGKTVWNSGSLHTQIKWLQDMKASICSSPEGCRKAVDTCMLVCVPFLALLCVFGPAVNLI